MAAHNDLGKLGEERSVEYLQSEGFVIRHRNWRSGRYELDIVAEKDDMIVVFEVKCRKAGCLVPPYEAIDRTKMRNVVYGLNAYIHRFGIRKQARIDVISMEVDETGKVQKLEHMEDAFMPGVNM